MLEDNLRAFFMPLIEHIRRLPSQHFFSSTELTVMTFDEAGYGSRSFSAQMSKVITVMKTNSSTASATCRSQKATEKGGSL